MKKGRIILMFFFFTANYHQLCSQNTVIDEVIAVVGEKIVLKSDLEIQYLQYLSQTNEADNGTLKCQILEQLLIQKLLLTQSIIDSIEVTDEQVEEALDNRIKYFSGQFGSEERLEEYYKKSVLEIKEEFRPTIKEHLLVQKMQGKITDGVKITPSEVKKFYNDIPKDSLPLIPSEVEVGHIIKLPGENKAVKESIKQKLVDIRQRIIKGESFASLAGIYSQDPGSAKNGGELGFVNRGELVSEFEASAFNLKESEVSEVVESPFGFHLIQLIERRGESINVRHILLKPEVTSFDMEGAKAFLDSIATLIANDSLSFDEAAKKFTDDEETKSSDGMLINQQSGTSKIPMDQLDPTLYFQIDTLNVGSVSSPTIMTTKDGKQAYRLVYYKSKSTPHIANIKDDYQKIQTAALTSKQEEIFKKWMDKKLINNYVQIDGEYQSCDNIKNWLKK